MNTNQKVTAIVCAYNEEKTIRGVMETLVHCPRIDEVIVVDDGSRDKTAKILGEFKHWQHVKTILLTENCGKGYGMATAAAYAKGDLLLFVDADLIHLSNRHVDLLLDTLINEAADMVLGFPVRGKAMSFAERLDPFPRLSGQRVVYRNDFLKLSDVIYTSGYGVETILNDYYQEQGKRVCSVFLPNLIHPIKFEKSGLLKAIGEYGLEGKEILAIKLKKPQLFWQSILCVMNRK